MSRCDSCMTNPVHPDKKCCFNCARVTTNCEVWHNCGQDCPGWENKVKTNADRIRSMTDDELSDFLCGIAYAGSEKWSEPFMRKFCDKCPPAEGVVTETGQKLKFYECDFKDSKCPHGSDILWWLKQPVEVDHES